MGWPTIAGNVVAVVAKRAVISSGVIVIARCYVKCVAMDKEGMVSAPICVVAVATMGGDFAVIAW